MAEWSGRQGTVHVRRPALRSDTLWLAGICAARLGSSVPYLAYAGVLPLLQAEWAMSATAAGSIASTLQLIKSNRKLENAGQRLGEVTGPERARGDPVRASPRATLPKSCSRGGTLLAARREVKGNCPNGGKSGSMPGGRWGGYQPSGPLG